DQPGLVLDAHGSLGGRRALTFHKGNQVAAALLPAGVALARAVSPAAVRDDVSQDLLDPDMQSCHGIALELVKMLKRPNVDILNDVGPVHTGTQTLAEQALGLPANPGAQLRKHGSKGLFVALPGLSQLT